MNIVEPSATLLWATPQAEKMIELAGRTCYKSEPKVFADCSECHGTGKTITEHVSMISIDGELVSAHNLESECKSCSSRSTTEFITKILKSKHESVLEHASASFRIVCDRGISHELVRHRIASYSQESSRYCNYANEKFGECITVIKPSQLNEMREVENKFPQANVKNNYYPNQGYLEWMQAIGACQEAYNWMIAHGYAPQVARSVLPTCLKTEIVMTTNFRSWRNFLKLRLDKAAHPDMIIVAKLICAELKKVAPTVFGEYP